jgi:predicted nuclease of restriction endonuclease-like (RecB) superfamily
MSARHGEQILVTLSQKLIAEFGRGFDATNLTRMMKFAEAFPNEEIVATLSQQLSWSHFRELLPLDPPLQQEFYAEMCRMEGWSVRSSMNGQHYPEDRKSSLGRSSRSLKSSGEVGPALILKDPYILDFLDLRDHYMERDFEDAILRELEMFLLELGDGFSFIARQKRIQLDGEEVNKVPLITSVTEGSSILMLACAGLDRQLTQSIASRQLRTEPCKVIHSGW